MARQKHWFDMMQHDRYYDNEFRDAVAAPEVKMSDVLQSNLADLIRLMKAFFVSDPSCGLNMSFFYKNRNCSIKNWNILPNVRKVK
jgi:hypothetical protein